MPRKYQRARLNPWGLLTLFMLTGSAAGMATALFCAWQMITGHPS